MKLTPKTVTHCTLTVRVGKTTQTTEFEAIVLLDKFPKNSGVGVCIVLLVRVDVVLKCRQTAEKKQSKNGIKEHEERATRKHVSQ